MTSHGMRHHPRYPASPLSSSPTPRSGSPTCEEYDPFLLINTEDLGTRDLPINRDLPAGRFLRRTGPLPTTRQHGNTQGITVPPLTSDRVPSASSGISTHDYGLIGRINPLQVVDRPAIPKTQYDPVTPRKNEMKRSIELSKAQAKPLLTAQAQAIAQGALNKIKVMMTPRPKGFSVQRRSLGIKSNTSVAKDLASKGLAAGI